MMRGIRGGYSLEACCIFLLRVYSRMSYDEDRANARDGPASVRDSRPCRSHSLPLLCYRRHPDQVCVRVSHGNGDDHCRYFAASARVLSLRAAIRPSALLRDARWC